MPDDCEILDCCLPDPFAFGKCSGVLLEVRIDPPGSGSATGAGRYEPGDEATVCATPAVPTAIDVGADFVFVVDESALLLGAPTLMSLIVTGIEQRLNDAGIGSGTEVNRYAVVAFGHGGLAENEIDFLGYTAFLAAVPAVVPRDIAPHLAEDAYDGISFAINQMTWRESPTVSKVIFFISDEDRNAHLYVVGADQAAQFASLKAELIASGAILAGLIQDSLQGVNNGDDSHPLIACDYTVNPVYQMDGTETSATGRSYYADGIGGFVETEGVNTVNINWHGDSGAFPTGVQAEYFDLVMDQDIRGYWFDLFLYLQSAANVSSINAVIVTSLAERIAMELTSTFVGWYDFMGNLLTTDTCYTFTIQSDVVLTARFVLE